MVFVVAKGVKQDNCSSILRALMVLGNVCDSGFKMLKKITWSWHII